MNVKRYSPGCCPQEPMVERTNGTYVKYDTLAALKEEKEVQTLRHEIERDQLKAQVVELLDALGNLLLYLDTDDMPALDMNKARAAIAKATGANQ